MPTIFVKIQTGFNNPNCLIFEKNIQMHFFKLHGVQFNKYSYHAFSNYGVKMKIYGKIKKYSNNLNRCVFGDTLHIKLQRISAFRTTTKYIFSNYGVIL